MGIIKRLKEIFNKNIDCGGQDDEHIVSYLKNKKYLFFNKNILVRDGYTCAIVVKNRLCDIVTSGKYKINKESLPEVFDRIKSKDGFGTSHRKIRADIYCVNLSEFKKFSFYSDIPFKVKNGELGKIKGCLEGRCSVRVIDSSSLIKLLVIKKGKITTKKIEKHIGLIIGNKINYIIQKNKIPTEVLLNNQEYAESIVNESMQDALDKAGLFVTNITLNSIKFSKKYQPKVNEYMSRRQQRVSGFNVNSLIEKNTINTPKIEVLLATENKSNVGTMQNKPKTQNNQQFLICRVCKKQNNPNSKICINCGNRLN
ncbi:MAG: SPFH domain-containing protein [Clostridia bacterium]|nr:SPFH domain-containing protein [Clostridia bacterium]